LRDCAADAEHHERERQTNTAQRRHKHGNSSRFETTAYQVQNAEKMKRLGHQDFGMDRLRTRSRNKPGLFANFEIPVTARASALPASEGVRLARRYPRR
jgi:hypothetical protein